MGLNIKVVIYILALYAVFVQSELLRERNGSLQEKDNLSLNKTCKEVECENGGTCEEDKSGSAFCLCREGSSGDYCEHVAACDSLKFRYCKGYNGTCVLGDKPYEAVCECNGNKTFDENLDICRATCKDSECENGGICTPDASGNTFCQCREGSTGDYCEKVPSCDSLKFRYCKGYNGTCVLGDQPYEAVCKCNDNKEFDENLDICRATCDEGDCRNGANCTADTSRNKFCQCRGGSTGDFCQIVPECDSLKFRYCKGYNGSCVLGDQPYEAVCECNYGKKFDDVLDICRETCKDSECLNDANCTVDANGNKFCYCREGSSGDLCQIVDACEDPKFQFCSGDNGTCVLGDEPYTAVCECNDDKEFDENLNKCRETCEDGKCMNGAICTADVTGNKFCKCREGSKGDFCDVVAACEDPKFKYCKGVNGTCVLGNQSGEAVCECNGEKEFDEKLNECRDTCTDNECKNDGMCMPDAYGNMFCQCRDGSIGDLCETVPACDDPKFKYCKGLNGTCTLGNKPYIAVCYCKDKKKFDENLDECRETCDNSDCRNGAICVSDANRHKFCQCRDGSSGDFCETVAGCKDPKFIYCLGDNGTCVLGDKSDEAICKCNGNMDFDDNHNECRENKCKTTCGEAADVICIGNPFEEEDVNCTCKDFWKEYVSRDKSCRVNMCKEVCGHSHTVTCHGDPYGKKVVCDCEEKTHIFIPSTKTCRSLCDPNPCFNGAECVSMGYRGFSCKCKNSYIGTFCNETSHTPDHPCHKDHVYVIVLSAFSGILLVILLVIGVILCQRGFLSYRRLE